MTDEASLAIEALFDFNNYGTESFDFFLFWDAYQIMWIKIKAEEEACEYMNYYTKIDEFMSHWDRFGGVVANMATDFALHYALDKETPIWKSWNDNIIPNAENGWSNIDWEVGGRGTLLFLSSLVKFENTEITTSAAVQSDV